MKLDLYSKISMVHAQATKLIMPNVSLHSPPSLSHSSPFCTAYLSIPFTSSKKADTCTDDVLLQTQSSNGEYNTEGAHMNKDVACTNRMHVQLDLARRKLHWASLTMDFSVPIAKHRKIRMRWVPYQKRHVLYALSDILWTFQFRSLDLIVRIDRIPSGIQVHWCMHFWQCIENDQQTIRTRKERMTHEDHEEGFAGW